jgi:3-deoxy-D-manno-octulosonic-acid transferase
MIAFLISERIPMSCLLDALYLVALWFLSPWLLYRAWKTGRYRQGLRAKLFGLPAPPPGLTPGTRPVWFHGVSVGEIHLLRQVVAAFRKRHPLRTCVLSTTTDTGLAEARKWFPDLPVFVFPFDFSWAVRRTLRQINPALIVLAEGELWPNFLMAARQRQVPVAVINGRMSPRSYARYRRLGSLPRWLLGHLELIAVQNESYAANLRALGVAADRVFVTGSVKFDSSTMERDHPRTWGLRSLLAISPGQLVWIAGSTQAPEEEIVLDIYQRIRSGHPSLRFIVVPRHPERFDEVAVLLEKMQIPYLRRSQLTAAVEDVTAVILGDTMGELNALWGLADLAFVGGSLDGKRGGQNMIEPAGYGAAVLFGPHVWNFRDVSQRLIEVGGAVQVADARELEQWIQRLLASEQERILLGRNGREFVLSQQGATERTIDLLTPLLERPKQQRHAA